MESALDWIATQQTQMEALVTAWADINSYSENLEGLNRMSLALQSEFRQLTASFAEVSLAPQRRVDARGNISSIPLGKALVIRKPARRSRSVLLSGHMDTVYSPDSGFLTCQRLNAQRLLGPGVADLKGGLVVLLYALLAFERSSYAQDLGWEVIINPDEEIGSTGSASLLRASAKRHMAGLVFEPGLPDGAFVSARKGSATYALVARGIAAHAGRDFAQGRNAIVMLLPIMQQLAALTDLEMGTTLNLGTLHAGSAINIVPDLAILQFGLRATTQQALVRAQQQIHDITRSSDLQLLEISSRLPKIFDAATERFYQQIKCCADQLHLPMVWKASGGVCDGNILAAEGLPTIDTLGPIGGNLHTKQEYVQLDSLVPRAQLAALILMQLAQ